MNRSIQSFRIAALIEKDKKYIQLLDSRDTILKLP